jgi:hypothetical protein
MASSTDNLDEEATQPIDPRLPQPVTHGQVSVHSSHPNHDALVGQMQRHLAEHVQHLSTTASYHKGVGVTGQDSKGAFSSGASGADYTTTNVGSDCGDADSGGPSGL